MEEEKRKVPIEGYISALLLLGLTILLFMQVIARYVFGTGVAWSEELSRYMFVWSIYFGCILAAKDDKHIRVTAQLMFLSERKKAWLVSIFDLVWVAFNIAMLVFGVKYVSTMFKYPFFSQTMRFNLAWVYAIVPFSFAFMGIHVVILIVRRVKGLLSHADVIIGDSRLDS